MLMYLAQNMPYLSLRFHAFSQTVPATSLTPVKDRGDSQESRKKLP